MTMGGGRAWMRRPHSALRRLVLLVLLAAVADAAELTAVTYNVWFDDASGKRDRYAAIIGYLGTSAADVICLQEVTDAFAVEVAGFARAKGYQVAFDQRPSGYGTAILSRGPIIRTQVIALPTRMGRQGLRCTTVLSGRTIQVTTAHLDSLPEDTERRIRQVQALDASVAIDCLWLGDFNFGDGQPEQAALGRWTDFGQGDPRPTYDPLANPLARQTAFANEDGRRLDRVLGLGAWTLARYRVDSGIPFSDHYPVVVTLGWAAAAVDAGSTGP